MPIELLMPALSPTMTEGNLAKWHKKEGDTVKAGDVIAGLDPAIPVIWHRPCLAKRDGRVKPGHDDSIKPIII